MENEPTFFVLKKKKFATSIITVPIGKTSKVNETVSGEARSNRRRRNRKRSVRIVKRRLSDNKTDSCRKIEDLCTVATITRSSCGARSNCSLAATSLVSPLFFLLFSFSFSFLFFFPSFLSASPLLPVHFSGSLRRYLRSRLNGRV